jgi:hypothetical protein
VPPPVAVDKLLREFAALPLCKRLLEALQQGAQRKVGGLWGGSAGLLVAVLQLQWRGRLLVVTADDVDSLQLQADLACFGAQAAVLPRQETADDGAADPQTRS